MTMRRRKWSQIALCLFCWSVVPIEWGQRVRVEFEGGYFLSRVICAGCAHVLTLRRVQRVSVLGRTLEVTKREQVAPHRIRGDGTFSCKGVWL